MSAKKPRRPVLIPKMGMFFFAYPAGCFQKGTVASKTDNDICFKIIVIE